MKSLRTARILAGYTIPHLAALCGVHPATIRAVEQGENAPSKATAEAIRTQLHPYLQDWNPVTRERGRPRATIPT